LEDEIDLREIIQTLLRYKFFILGMAVLFTLAGFVYVRMNDKDVYRAEATLVITRPIYQTTFDPNFTSAPQLPDARALVDLVTAEDLLLEVHLDARLENGAVTNGSLSALISQTDAVLVGGSQLSLRATDADPERAALIANVWAEKAAGRLNALFGIDRTSVEQLAAEKQAALQNWESAQQNLLAYLPESRFAALEASLGEEKLSLARSISKVNKTDILILDARVLEANLRGRNSADILPVEDRLSFIALTQRAAEGSGMFQIQVSEEATIGEEFTAAAVLDRLSRLTASLEAQKVELQGLIAGVESSISAQAAELEAAQFRIGELTLQRDLARRAYEALAIQEETSRLAFAQNDRLVRVSGNVIPPLQPVGGRSFVIILASAAAGLVLGMALALGVNWWKAPQAARQEIREKQSAATLGD
jgi:capsular polysaccharide biosynthesis protein